jgi:hypothetical protein
MTCCRIDWLLEGLGSTLQDVACLLPQVRLRVCVCAVT